MSKKSINTKKKINRNRRWTQNEDQYLQSNYGPLGGYLCSIRLNRTLRAVQHRALKLHLPRSNGWTIKDNNILKRHYATLGTRGCQVLLSVPRSRKAIMEHAHRQGLKYNDALPTARAKPNRWLIGEDTVLRTYAPNSSVRQIHTQHFEGNPYTRSLNAVAQRCGALGLTKSSSA